MLMKLRLVALIPVMLLAGAASSLAQQQGAASPAAAPQQNPSAPPTSAVAIPAYPDTPKGLEDLIKDMLKMQKHGDTEALDPYVQSLILPNPNAWFRSTFDERLGSALADSYGRTRIELPLLFPDILNQLLTKHLAEPKAARFSDSCDPEATPDEYTLLRRRTSSQALYDVRFSNGSAGAIVRYFAFVDGAFRYLGSFKVDSAAGGNEGVKAEGSGRRDEMLTVPGNVMAAKAIRSVPPSYPQEAKEAHVQGTVILHAIIGENGAVCNLQVVEGPALLTQAALSAVSQWRYRPTLLNGAPVAVNTTITVVFDLQ